MNIFEKAKAIETERKANARKGSTAPLRDTLTIPEFKGYVRKGERYSIPLVRSIKDDKGKVKAMKVDYSVKPLSGAFILSYFSCLAYDLCKAEKQPLTVFVVQALIEYEGFTLSEYSQGKVQGSARITAHLKAIAEQRGLTLSVNKDTGEIAGIEKYACKVIQAF